MSTTELVEFIKNDVKAVVAFNYKKIAEAQRDRDYSEDNLGIDKVIYQAVAKIEDYLNYKLAYYKRV